MCSWNVCFTQETLYSVTASVSSITEDERNSGPRSENSATANSCSKISIKCLVPSFKLTGINILSSPTFFFLAHNGLHCQGGGLLFGYSDGFSRNRNLLQVEWLFVPLCLNVMIQESFQTNVRHLKMVVFRYYISKLTCKAFKM